MTDFFNKIQNSTEIPENYKYYWGYMYQLGVDTVVSYLKENNAFKAGDSVAEIGSAEGGVLAALVEQGAKNALGTDIVEHRLEMGRKISDMGGINIQFAYHDIINEDLKPEWKNAFDLVLLRDVIEHLDFTTIALTNISKLIKPGGFLFVTFPPYYSPFGGHQHTVGNKLGMVPYVHLLPNPLFYSFLNGGRENDIGEVKRLQTIKLTPKKFLKSVEESGFKVYKQDYYLLRPVFKMKFGLPTIKTTAISGLPLVKDLFSLEACYILQA